MSVASAGRRILWVVGIALVLTFAFHALYPWTAITAPIFLVLACAAYLAVLAGETVWSAVAKRSRAPAPRAAEPPRKGRDT